MTTATSPTTVRRSGPSDPYVRWLLRTGDRKNIHYALRRASTPGGEARAITYLAPYMTDSTKSAMLLHASAFATYEHARHRRGDTLGLVVRNLVRQGVISENTARKRLTATGEMTLSNAHRVFSSFLHAAHSTVTPVDWEYLWHLYANWDHPDRDVRRNSRWEPLGTFETR